MTTCWLEDYWLVAIWQKVPADEVRRWWNCKDTDLLDDIVETAPTVRLGTIVTCGEDPEPACPARRVFELLSLRGTLPEEFTDGEVDPYVVPLLNDDLEAAVLEAFQPRTGDRRELDVGDRVELASFLRRHKGAGLLTRSRGGVSEIKLELS